MNERKKKILIVEDDPDIILALASILEDAGYTVAKMDGDTSAIQVSEKRDLPDLLLVDMFLSGQDGRAITRQWKSHDTTQHIPILMLSAYPNAEQEAKTAGADDFLAKPFELDDLLAKVTKHLA